MRKDGRTVSLALAAVTLCVIAGAPAIAAAPSCATVANTAFLNFNQGQAPHTISSNVATIRIEQLLDLGLAADVRSLTLPEDARGTASFTLVNTGNGDEAFLLDGRIEGADAVIEGFALDRDGNGAFDAAVDLPIAIGAATSKVAPGASLKLLALVRTGASAQAAGTLHLHARSTTGIGQPGTSLTGLGGCDAVVGSTGASADLGLSLTVASGTDTSQIRVIKSQTIVAPNGSAIPVKGATVTYSIESRFGGGGVVRSARLADPIPPGTAYIPGSIKLDDVALTDAADGDTASFDGGAIRVALGDVPTPATRRVTFQVKIQ